MFYDYIEPLKNEKWGWGAIISRLKILYDMLIWTCIHFTSWTDRVRQEQSFKKSKTIHQVQRSIDEKTKGGSLSSVFHFTANGKRRLLDSFGAHDPSQMRPTANIAAVPLARITSAKKKHHPCSMPVTSAINGRSTDGEKPVGSSALNAKRAKSSNSHWLHQQDGQTGRLVHGMRAFYGAP